MSEMVIPKNTEAMEVDPRQFSTEDEKRLTAWLWDQLDKEPGNPLSQAVARLRLSYREAVKLLAEVNPSRCRGIGCSRSEESNDDDLCKWCEARKFLRGTESAREIGGGK